MNPHIATLLKWDPHLIEGPITITDMPNYNITTDSDGILLRSPTGRTTVSIANHHNGASAVFVIEDEDLPSLMTALEAHYQEMNA